MCITGEHCQKRVNGTRTRNEKQTKSKRGKRIWKFEMNRSWLSLSVVSFALVAGVCERECHLEYRRIYGGRVPSISCITRLPLTHES